MKDNYALPIIALSALLLAGAAGPKQTYDFAKYDESQWVPAREGRFPSVGAFLQKEGYVINSFPDSASKEDLLHAKGGVGYAMRLLKGAEIKDGRAELTLSVQDGAAPSIAFRVQMAEGEVHGALYNLVIFNQSTPERTYEGVNLWKWTVPAAPAPAKWEKLAYWRMPIPRETKIKLGVEFQGEAIRVFVDDKEIGGVLDKAALGPGKIGVVAIEGPCKFYEFSVTPQY